MRLFRWNEPASRSTRLALYYTSDVHGSERCFLEFFFNRFYPYRCDQRELARMEADPQHAVEVFRRTMREAIERYQPVLSLHGHIHESRGAVRIGRTLCINPGSAYGEGVLHGALVVLEGDRVASYQLVSG